MRSYFILMFSIIAFAFITQPAQAGIHVSFHDRPIARGHMVREHVVIRPQRFSHFIATERYAPMREVIVIRSPRHYQCDRRHGRNERAPYHRRDYY